MLHRLNFIWVYTVSGARGYDHIHKRRGQCQKYDEVHTTDHLTSPLYSSFLVVDSTNGEISFDCHHTQGEHWYCETYFDHKTHNTAHRIPKQPFIWNITPVNQRTNEWTNERANERTKRWKIYANFVGAKSYNILVKFIDAPKTSPST